jgi:hypothetical protein
MQTLILMTAVALGAAAHPPADTFEADREAILAMAGEFEVRFHFEETMTFGDASPSEPHTSGAREWVTVVEDEGDFISLQHILLAGDPDDPSVVKHWRQDWRYEAPEVLAFTGGRTWERVPVPEAGRQGSWTQTVHQVDDSPRYASWGRWRHVGDVAYWESAETWRPLPRREHTKRDDYDVLVGENRHLVTPEGWVHQQDNYKLALRDGGQQVLAWETGRNTYTRAEDADFSRAREYWEDTSHYWAAVRDAWDAALEGDGPVRVAADGNTTDLMRTLMDHAETFAEGRFDGVPHEVARAEIAPYVTRPDQAAR